jgi:hypothetical protein
LDIPGKTAGHDVGRSSEGLFHRENVRGQEILMSCGNPHQGTEVSNWLRRQVPFTCFIAWQNDALFKPKFAAGTIPGHSLVRMAHSPFPNIRF